MRGSYYRLILNQLKKGRILWFPMQVWKYFAIPISQRIGKPLSGPVNGSLFVTYRCNSDCVMCDYPQRAGKMKGAGLKELDTSEMVEIIHDFADMGTTGLGFTGGEPLLRKDIYNLLKTSVDSGMITNINTNGYLIDDAIAKELINTGLDSINISFDGATDETFERLRGTKGGLGKAIRAIENLNKFKGQRKDKPMVNAVTVISSENVDEIDEIIKLLKGLNVDYIGFMPIHDFSFEKDKEGLFKPTDKQNRLKIIVDRLLENWDEQLFESSKEYIELFNSCFEGKKNPLTCYAGYSHIMIDCYGRVFPCWPWIEKDKAIGYLNNGTRLKELWYSSKLGVVRKELAGCHECFWNCHTELNLLFNFPLPAF